MSNTKKLQGFSLVEMIVVIAAMAAIISISFGDITRLFDKQVIEGEKIVLQKIRKAMEVYAKMERTLPTNIATCDKQEKFPPDADIWSMELAKYSNLSADQICFDEMGVPRYYFVAKVNEPYYNGSYSYDVYYASVLGSGINKVKQTDNWDYHNNKILGNDSFTKYVAQGDDLLVKYNDSDAKLALYEETLRRITELEKSLERYARSRRAAAMTLGIAEYDKYIFYPKDASQSDPGDYFDSSISGVDSNTGVATIDDPMKATSLTKVLGLPDYIGVDAMTGKSMWYISNPGKDRSSPCGRNFNDSIYPPAIIITTDGQKPDGC